MHLPKTLLSLTLILLLTTSFAGENASAEIENFTVDSEVREIWQTSGLESTDISLKAFYRALSGYNYLKRNLSSPVGENLVIIDFSQPSDRKRLVVFNVGSNSIAYTSLVAHGRNSGENLATSFSNTVQSFQSSLGFYLTAETYEGKHGYSLRLDGLESGFNDNARERAVVMHGADYATEEFIEQNGRLGRSFGCPSLPPDVSAEIIDSIKGNNVLFIYADDEDYLASSEILNHENLMLATAKSW